MEDFGVVLGRESMPIPNAVILVHLVDVWHGDYEAKRPAMFMMEQKDVTRERVMRPTWKRPQGIKRSRKSSKRAQFHVVGHA